MKTMNQEFRKIDDLLIEVGNYLMRGDKTVVINTVFDKLVGVINSIEVNSSYREEKQKRTNQFIHFWNETKNSTKNTHEIGSNIYTIVLQSLVEIYLWLMDIRNT